MQAHCIKQAWWCPQYLLFWNTSQIVTVLHKNVLLEPHQGPWKLQEE
jgi:hypothetical protein